MTFQEIFEQDGYYVADFLGKGIAFKISNVTLYIVNFLSCPFECPPVDNINVCKYYFDHDYRKVTNKLEAFEDFDKRSN